MLKLLIIALLFRLALCAFIPTIKEQEPRVPQLDGRIVGGIIAHIFQHPHQVALRYKSCEACRYSHLCGGSILSKDVVITAAHCVRARQAKDFIIVAGTEIRNGGDGVITRVKKIIMHEDYNSSLTDKDVALMFLDSSLPVNGLAIANVPLADTEPKHGLRATVTGWGNTREGGVASQQLLEVDVPIVSNDLCNDAYGEGRITESMLCAGVTGKGGKDACQGDSGGPLLSNGELIGIVSWGRGCARPDFPGVYANVPNLRNWITKTIENYEAQLF